MVCKECEKKLPRIVTNEVWREGSRNTGTRSFVNKLTTAQKTFSKCRLCGSMQITEHTHYCQSCAYRHGICAMCGVKVVDVSLYRQRDA